MEQTLGPNGQVNSYDVPRPMSWYRVLASGSRVFYTALGHAHSNYTSDMLFRVHIRDALAWLMEGTTGVSTNDGGTTLQAFPNPASDHLMVVTDASGAGTPLNVLDATGRAVLDVTITSERTRIVLNDLPSGTYLLRAKGAAVKVRIIR